MVGVDKMAQASPHTATDVRPAAMRIAQEWLGQDELIRTDQEFLRYIGALRSDDRLSEAAALLFCSVGFIAVELTEFDVPGGNVFNRFAPRPDQSLAEQIAMVEAALDVMNTQVTVNSGLRDQHVRRVPRDAVREALLNGLIHRDWNLHAPTEVRWFDADSCLEVDSPGGFVGEIDETNVLSQREARYPALADLFRALSLVDKQGVGVDRMYRAQISLGHRPPEILELPGPRVRTTLRGGVPATPVVRLISSIRPVERQRDFRLAILVYCLLHHPYVSIDDLAGALQATAESARNTIETALQTMVGGEPLIKKYADVWILGEPALDLVESAHAGDSAFPILEYRSTDEYRIRQTVIRWLKTHDSVSTGDVMLLSGVARGTAKRLLDSLVDDGTLVQRGQGRSSRYELARRD